MYFPIIQPLSNLHWGSHFGIDTTGREEPRPRISHLWTVLVLTPRVDVTRHQHCHLQNLKIRQIQLQVYRCRSDFGLITGLSHCCFCTDLCSACCLLNKSLCHCHCHMLEWYGHLCLPSLQSHTCVVETRQVPVYIHNMWLQKKYFHITLHAVRLTLCQGQQDWRAHGNWRRAWKIEETGGSVLGPRLRSP